MAGKKRYEVGLQKLDFTGSQVAIMQDELTALKPSLIKTVAETEVLMVKVQKEKTEVGATFKLTIRAINLCATHCECREVAR